MAPHAAVMSASSARTLAYGLGWFSIGLGLAELFAPKKITRALGMRGSEGLVQAYGVREIAAGVGILVSHNPAPWLWGRVGGDALDLATLATGLDEVNHKRDNVAAAIAAVAGVTVLDVLCAQALTAQQNAPPPRIYDYSNRSGLPAPPSTMRGAARDFEAPRDFRIPEALRPWRASAVARMC